MDAITDCTSSGMAYNRRDDDLAYGDYPGQQHEGGEGDRGLIGDVGRRFFGGGKKNVSTWMLLHQCLSAT